jgi:hypothetical protein
MWSARPALIASCRLSSAARASVMTTPAVASADSSPSRYAYSGEWLVEAGIGATADIRSGFLLRSGRSLCTPRRTHHAGRR